MYLKNLNNVLRIRISNIMLHKLSLLASMRNKSVSDIVRDIILQYLAMEDIKEDEYTESIFND